MGGAGELCWFAFMACSTCVFLVPCHAEHGVFSLVGDIQGTLGVSDGSYTLDGLFVNDLCLLLCLINYLLLLCNTPAGSVLIQVSKLACVMSIPFSTYFIQSHA